MPEDIRLKQEIQEEFREKITTQFITAMQDRTAVWQDEKDIPLHMPVNPISEKYFQNANAMILLQRQHDLGTTDSRWVQQNQIERVNGFINKGEKATVIETKSKDGKTGYTRYFNFSQMHPKDKTKPFEPLEIYDKKMDQCASEMLDHSKVFTVDTLMESKDAFFEMARNVYRVAYVMAHENNAVKEAVENRIKAIQEISLEKKARIPSERFLQECKKALEKNPDSKGFVVEAAKALLLEGVYSKTKIKALITQHAPGAARDGESKSSKYSEYVFNGLEKDTKFQQAAKKLQQETQAVR
jgi:Domain of unknown function (DUF1738).